MMIFQPVEPVVVHLPELPADDSFAMFIEQAHLALAAQNAAEPYEPPIAEPPAVEIPEEPAPAAEEPPTPGAEYYGADGELAEGVELLGYFSTEAAEDSLLGTAP